MGIKFLTLVILAGILFFVVDLIRRSRLTFKYAVGWIFICLLGIFFVIFDQLLFRLAGWFGFLLPSNFIFFVLLCFFILLSLFLTIFLCQQNSRNDTIAQKIGLLELEIKKLKEIIKPR